jgi:hypothetical protein
VVLALHFTFVGYVVLGGFLAWRWPKAIVAHLAAAAWGGLIVLGWVNCPLTWAEDRARVKAGQAPATQGFVDRYLDNVLYPERYLTEVRFAVAAVIAGSWLGAYLLWRRGRNRGLESRESTSERGTSEAEAKPIEPDTEAKRAPEGGHATTV